MYVFDACYNKLYLQDLQHAKPIVQATSQSESSLDSTCEGYLQVAKEQRTCLWLSGGSWFSMVVSCCPDPRSSIPTPPAFVVATQQK